MKTYTASSGLAKSSYQARIKILYKILCGIPCVLFEKKSEFIHFICYILFLSSQKQVQKISSIECPVQHNLTSQNVKVFHCVGHGFRSGRTHGERGSNSLFFPKTSRYVQTKICLSYTIGHTVGLQSVRRFRYTVS